MDAYTDALYILQMEFNQDELDRLEEENAQALEQERKNKKSA